MSDAWPMEGASTAAGLTQQASDAPTSTASVMKRAQGRMVSGSIRHWYGIGINEVRYRNCALLLFRGYRYSATVPVLGLSIVLESDKVTGTARLYRVCFLYTGERPFLLLFFSFFLFPITVYLRLCPQGFAESWQR